MTLSDLAATDQATLPAEAVFRLVGCGRTCGYEQLRRGAFPLAPIKLGRRIVFATRAVQALLGVQPATGAARAAEPKEGARD